MLSDMLLGDMHETYLDLMNLALKIFMAYQIGGFNRNIATVTLDMFPK